MRGSIARRKAKPDVWARRCSPTASACCRPSRWRRSDRARSRRCRTSASNGDRSRKPIALRALADIEPLQLGRLLTQRSAGADSVWWVNTGPVTTRGAADKRAAELRLLAIDDLSVVDLGKGQFTVSLGMFRTEGAANARVEALATRGVAGTRVEPRATGVTQSMLVVRDPPQTAVARLKELQLQYPGSDLKVGACTAS